MAAVALLVALAACDKAPTRVAAAEPAAAVLPDAKGPIEADAASPAAGTPRPQDRATVAVVGEAAPNFALPDLDGTHHALADYAGKTVVLEWFNPECPFVNYAHKEGPLVAMAQQRIDAGIVWLAINSGAPGMQGAAPASNRDKVAEFGMHHPVLLDPDGVVGRLYGAVKTPHMFVIDARGILVFAGGVDNAPFGEVEGEVARADYLTDALTAVAAGKPVTKPTASAWGCTVKYAPS